MTDRDDNIDAEAMDIMRRYPDMFRLGTGPTRNGFLWSPGWYPLLHRLFSDIDDIRREDDLARIRVSQVKHKLGELLVYVQGGNDRVSDRSGAAA